MKKLIYLVSILFMNKSIAQWNAIPTPNNEVIGTGVVNSIQRSPDISALNTAAYTYATTWHDNRTAASNYDIYAQIYASNGIRGVAANGVLICNATAQQFNPRIVTSTTAPEFFIAWEDRRNGNYDIYCQKINQLGVVQWTTNGIPVTTSCGDQKGIELIPDGNGGVIITWVDERNGDMDIFAQKLNTSGVAQWKQNGVPICTAPEMQYLPKIKTDFAGGAVIVWEDRRVGWAPDVYIQKINSAGVVQFANDGNVVAPFSSSKSVPELVTASTAMGVRYFVSWLDSRTTNDAYYVLLNSSGTAISSAIGTNVSTGIGANARTLNMISDRTGGVFIAWDDFRNGNYDIYAQNIDFNGAINTAWPAAGVRVCDESSEQWRPKMASCDDQLIIAFHDLRNPGPSGADIDLYYQNINTSNGTLNLTINGTALANSNYSQKTHRVTVMHGNVVAVWEDGRRMPADGGDIYISPMPITCTNYPTTSNASVKPMENKNSLKSSMSNLENDKVSSNTVNSEQTSLTLQIIPNPAASQFKIQPKDGSFVKYDKIEVLDLTGKVILSSNGKDSNTEFNLADKSEGTYIINIYNNNKIQQLKLIKSQN